MIYSSGNSAKQWILADLEQRFGKTPLRIMDLACGSGWVWEKFLEIYPDTKIIGVDTDAVAIKEGQKKYEGKTSIELKVFDAQQIIKEELVDVVVALSAIEHVVDKPAFLRTAYEALKPNGLAYLNYDDGHFRSADLKERLMVPVSQILAMFGKEKWYMKHVDDVEFKNQIESQEFRVLKIRKHNFFPLKGFMRGASKDAIEAWFAFEEKLGELYTSEKLDRVMWSTTFVVQKI